MNNTGGYNSLDFNDPNEIGYRVVYNYVRIS